MLADALRNVSARAMIGAALIVAMPLTFVAAHQLAALRAARAQSVVARPEIQPRGEAVQALRERLRRTAVTSAVSLDFAPATIAPGLIAVRVNVTGPQPAVIDFAELIETQAPAARFAAWRIEADPAGIRLSGTVSSPAGDGR